MAILNDLIAYLQAQGLCTGQTGDWPMFAGYLPDDPNNVQAMAAFETGGQPPTEIQRPNERVTVQLRVRSTRLNYAIARQQWLDCFNAIQDSVIGQPTVYIYWQAMHYGPIFFNDDKGRPNFITNFVVMRITETS